MPALDLYRIKLDFRLKAAELYRAVIIDFISRVIFIPPKEYPAPEEEAKGSTILNFYLTNFLSTCLLFIFTPSIHSVREMNK